MSELITNSSKRRVKEPDRTRPVLDLTRTVAREIFNFRTRPWDAIPYLNSYIRDHGHEMPYEEYDEVSEGIWVHLSAYLAPTAKIEAPAIICGGAKICHGALISGSVIGSFASVGELSSVKSSVLFDRSRLCGHNSIASSILGYESVIGVNSVIPDSRLDSMNVTVDMPEGTYVFGKDRLGAVICDGVKIGASCVINPGTVIDTGCTVYPLTSVSGYVYPYTAVR
jgi:NDP-sugar pyrophosphorylase family protein